jgi:anti-sigma-K factor RskA
MNPESDLHPHDDLAIYALDALDPDEHAALDEHLAGCPSCRAELEEHRTTLARLVVPAEEPPPSVWAGIAQQLPQLGGPAVPSATLPGADATAADPGGSRYDQGDATAPVVPSATLPGADATAAQHGGSRYDSGDSAAPVVPLHAPLHVRRRSFAERSGWLAAAAALVVVLGLGAVLVTRSGDQPDTVADLAAAAADAPGATVIPLSTDGGDEVARVVLAGDAGATDYVIFDNLDQAPAGQAYQLWKTAGSAPPVSLGVVGDGGGGAAAISAPADVTALALSQEVDTGVPAPTGPVVATGQRA